MPQEIKSKIEENLINYINGINFRFKFNLIDPILCKSIQEFCLRPGKRIRPFLLITSYKGYSKKKKIHPSIFYASTAMELLHNFMLIHDDIIDESDLRRGKPTMHKLLKKTVKNNKSEKLGYDLAIIAGDIVYALALDAFSNIREDIGKKEKSLKYFIETTISTAIGEFIDTAHGVEKLTKVKNKDVMLNYTLKTAHYTFIAPLVIGALLSGARNSEIKKLKKLGLFIGQAFQIQDDIIGVFDTQKNIGKSILSDIEESKKTILVCKTFESLLKKDRSLFSKIFDKNHKTYNDLVTLRKIFIKSKSLEYSFFEIKLRLENAIKILRSLNMDNRYKKIIESCFISLFDHSNRIAKQYKIDITVN